MNGRNGSIKSIQQIKIEDVQRLFGSEIYARGEEYFEEGYVKSIEPLNSATIAGIVYGTQKYNVSASIGGEDDIVCKCSCPCDFNCKHAAALLLKWLSVKKNYKTLKNGGRHGRESIDEMLSKKSKEELAAILKDIIIKHPELKPLVKVEQGEILQEIIALFSQFWDWNETGGLTSRLDNILEGIRRNKTSWDKDLLREMEMCSAVMAENTGNVHDDNGELGTFVEEWFATYGEVFSKTKPTADEKKVFVMKILDLIKKDDYGFDTCYERALNGMCSTKEDIGIIKEGFKSGRFRYATDYGDLFLELYDKLGMDKEYLHAAREGGFSEELIDKLVSLNRLEEALEECKKNDKKDFWGTTIEDKKIEILKKLGRKEETNEAIFELLKRTGIFSYFLKLKQECRKDEWKKYLGEIVAHSKNNKRFDILSRAYYTEGDLKAAYEYSGQVIDYEYLELLAKKLGGGHPELACNLFKRLCFIWIEGGAGWPYKKAGKMLAEIKKLDKKGGFFREAKEEVIAQHKKKYSLMHIVEAV